MLFDEMIYAAGVGVENGAGCVGSIEAIVAVRGASETEGAELLVNVEGSGAQDFGELAASDATQEIHLPEAVLRHDVALGFDHVFDGICANVGDAPVIALDDDVFLEAWESDGAVELR